MRVEAVLYLDSTEADFFTPERQELTSQPLTALPYSSGNATLDIETNMPPTKTVVFGSSGQILQRKTVSHPGRTIQVEKLTVSASKRGAVSRATQVGRAAQQGKK
jgi:hypothetical protein